MLTILILNKKFRQSSLGERRPVTKTSIYQHQSVALDAVLGDMWGIKRIQ
jgi:hypothetical protein